MAQYGASHAKVNVMLVNSGPTTEDDFVIVERSGEDRGIVGMVGQYALGSWRDADGNPRLFPCRIVKFSAQAITLDAPVSGNIGAWVSAQFKSLGQFEGPVIRKLPGGLVMRIVATYDDRVRLDAKIAWHENPSRPEKRLYPRWVPKQTCSTVWLADRGVLPCLIIDCSASGAGITAEFTPEIGTTVKLGLVIGRVVRHFNGGFGIKYLVIQSSDDVEQLITGSPPP